MNITTFKRVLPSLLKTKVVPFLWGSQGVGKTQTVKQVAKELGIGFVHLHLATQEVGDLVGLLIKSDDDTVRHARPEWFPTEGQGILFLDELNRAHPDVLQAMFSLITEGTIHRHKLPDGWSIVAAGNYQTNQFNVTDTSDAAWLSRFCHIDFIPSKEEFVHFAESRGLSTVADFIGSRGEFLESEVKTRFDFNSVRPDRRTWGDMVGRLESESAIEEYQYEIYQGLVGPVAAAAFIQHKKHAAERVSGKQVLMDYGRVRSKIQADSDSNEARFDRLNSIVEEMLMIVEERPCTTQEMTNFKQFMLDVPLEMGLKIINRLSKSAWKQKDDIMNSPEFVDMYKKAKFKRK